MKRGSWGQRKPGAFGAGKLAGIEDHMDERVSRQGKSRDAKQAQKGGDKYKKKSEKWERKKEKRGGSRATQEKPLQRT